MKKSTALLVYLFISASVAVCASYSADASTLPESEQISIEETTDIKTETISAEELTIPTTTPDPTKAPEPTATPTATPIPTKAPVKQLSVEELKKAVSKYGSFIGGAGMSYEDYTSAMNQEWSLVEHEGVYEELAINIADNYTYKALTDVWKNLSLLDGVSLYKIGASVEGRPLYMICIDRTSVKNPKTVVLTGNVHARETAGSIYITKQLNDFLNDERADEYLKNIRIYAVPCVNPDGREGIAYDYENWTYSAGAMKKCNANGVDINRNFPGLSWGQIKKGNSKVSLWSDTHEKMYFPGYTAGSEPETKALMKFLQYTIVDLQADILIDYHQQGQIQYAGKPWQTKEQQKKCSDLAKAISTFMADNKKYVREPEAASYGLRGEGSTLTDYACSLAVGAKFSETYGFMVYTDGKNEYPLITGKRTGREANPNFATTTLEIGITSAYLGYNSATRKNLANEYTKYHFDELLYEVFNYISEEDLTLSQIKEKEFKVLDQKKYPTGCESVSSTMVLNYYGYDVTVDEFIDNHLDMISSKEKFYADKKNTKKFVFDYYFVGNPRKESGSACNSPVIMNALNSYFDSIENVEHTPVNLTGKSFSEVAKIANSGSPVLLWVSGELKGPTRTYELAGKTVRTNRHCCVLLSTDEDTVTVADPMIGEIREWDYDKVEEQFNLYGKQAVCLEEA